MKDRLLVAASLIFALLASTAYFAAVRERPPAPVVQAPTPDLSPPPIRKRSRPLRQPTMPKTGRQESALRPVPTDPEGPAPPHVFAHVTGRALLSGGSPAQGATVLAYIGGRRKVFSTEADGSFQFRMPAGHYRLRAERMDGQLVTSSDWVELDTSEGGEWEVDLVLPEETRGGLGIRIGKHRDGIRVRAVLPGSPAEELGLLEGDVVIALGGESVAGWTTADFAAVMSGAIGSEQRFTVRRADGVEEDLVFERRFLER